MKKVILRKFILLLVLFFIAACGKKVINPLLVPPASALSAKKIVTPLENLGSQNKVKSSDTTNAENSSATNKNSSSVDNSTPTNTAGNAVKNVKNTEDLAKTNEDKKENVKIVVVKTEPLRLTTNQEISVVNSILFQ